MNSKLIKSLLEDANKYEYSFSPLTDLYRKGDELHLIHVIPRKQFASSLGAPPVDSLPHESLNSEEDIISSTQHFIKSRFVTKLDARGVKSVVHVVKVRLDQ